MGGNLAAMTLCYIGTPVTPAEALLSLAGRAFCLCYYNRRTFNIETMRGIASQTLIDVGTYPAWKAGIDLDDKYCRSYLEWVDPLLDSPTTIAVIPDPIGMGTQILDAHIREWPFGDRGSPVYHLDEDFTQPVERMLRLLDEWPRVCIGWAEKDLPIAGEAHAYCLDHLWNEISKRHKRTPDVLHFRGTQLVRHRWPFARLDGTDVARNHHRPQNTPVKMADRWDAGQCPDRWEYRELQPRLPHV